jgi:hypothetical protein
MHVRPDARMRGVYRREIDRNLERCGCVGRAHRC